MDDDACEVTIGLQITDQFAADERLVLRLGVSPQLSPLRPRLGVDVVVNRHRLARLDVCRHHVEPARPRGCPPP